MAKQKTKELTHEKMEHRYTDDVHHKHNKDHQEYREHSPSHGHHIHGGENVQRFTHHHHHTTHHHHHYYYHHYHAPVTIHNAQWENKDELDN